MSEFDHTMPDESEQLDQLQPDETLIDRGVGDVLDEGYIAPEHWSPAQTFGNTRAEMRRGETFEQRLAQEVPEVAPSDEPWNDDPSEIRQVGRLRAGRLVADEDDLLGHMVGIDGGAATAEEAAMHVIDDYEDDDD